MITPWRVELFGGLRAVQADRVVTRFRTQKTGLLLAYLALTDAVETLPARTHRRDALAALLWPEAERRAGLNHLKAVLRWLRQGLEPPGVPFGTVLVADRTSVGLHPDAVIIDVAEFLAALDAARRCGSDAEQLGYLIRVVDLYQGELLPGQFEDWVLQERPWLAERFFQALGRLLAILERSAELDRALEYAQRGVSIDPLREEAHRNLMRLLAAVGQTSAARRQYRELERLLQEHLVATPDAATRALAQEIERLAVLVPAGVRAFKGALGSSSAPPDEENRLVTLLSVGARRCHPPQRRSSGEPTSPLDRLLPVVVDILLRYEGRIDRLGDDGLLGVFGVPQTHEDDPERAIRAALEIREAAAHLGSGVQTGIATGEVVVGRGGSERDSHQLVAGPAVDLAVRLQQQAQPGEIRVGEVTRRLTRRAFRFAALPGDLSGRSDPERVHLVERAVPRPEKSYGIEGVRAELIGRSAELARLQAVLAEALAGRGQMVALVGEAGVGKSRLVAELRGVTPPSGPASSGGAIPSRLASLPGTERWEGEEFSPLRFGEGLGEGLTAREESGEGLTPLWLEGRCFPLTMTAGYSVFVDLFRDYFAWRPEESDTERGARLIGALRELVAQGELSEEWVEEIGPLLGRLLSLRFGSDWDQRLQNAGPEQIKHQTFVALCDFLLAVARRQPLVLVLEDLHWADRLSLDLIPFLLEAATDVPLLLLCVYRPEKEHRCRHLTTTAARKCPAQSTELHLSELTPGESRCLVASLLQRGDLPSAIIEPLVERTRGNPFFLAESIRALIGSGVFNREGGVWRAREPESGAPPGATTAVPESIQRVIGSRVDRLAPELKQVLQRAAVIGQLFRRRLLEQMLLQSDTGGGTAGGARVGVAPPSHLDSALWELEEQGLIYQERVVPEEEFSFQHVLTQEAVYQSLLPARRALFHQQVGEAIETLDREGLDAYCEQLAYHYERSPVDGKAVEYLLKAGEKARRAYLSEDAISYFQRALERLDGSSLAEVGKRHRLDALRGLGQIYHGGGREQEAEECFSQAIALGREIGLATRDLVRLHYWLGDVLSWQNRFLEMARVGEEGRALLGEDTTCVEAALMNHTLAAGYGYGLPDPEKYREFAHRNVPLLDALPYCEELRPAHDGVAITYAWYDKKVEEARRWLQAFERKAAEHHDLLALAEVHNWTAALILVPTGDLRGATSRCQQALELCARIGDTRHEGAALSRLCEYFLRLGDLPRAAEHAERYLRSKLELGLNEYVARAYWDIGRVALCQGDRAKAADAFQRATALFRETHTPLDSERMYTLGQAYAWLGARREAIEHLEAAAASAKGVHSPVLAAALRGLEETIGDPDAFLAFCRHLRAEHPDVGGAPFVQWCLEPIEPLDVSRRQFSEAFLGPLSSDWVWDDLFGDCSYTLENGLEIQVANGRGMWYVNVSAPRLLRSASGEFVIETVCTAVTSEKPAMGGLLLWKDRQNFLRLDCGARGRFEISFMGCVADKEVIIGRGRLPSERVFLRMEQLRRHVNALCSPDGSAWFTVGRIEFPCDDPVEVGLAAFGTIDRLIYPGAYPTGTAIRFEGFTLWR